MNEHTLVRLEKVTTVGPPEVVDVVAYLAPTALVIPVTTNDLFARPRKDGDTALVRDLRKLTEHVTVQGSFDHSDNLPQAHQDDLEALFGALPVTARQQVNRVNDYLFEHGGPFRFYNDGDEYRDTTKTDANRAQGIYPVVSVKSFRPEYRKGMSSVSYVLEMLSGVLG